jgi:diguanylate cyclase (GGDEF)-like protein
MSHLAQHDFLTDLPNRLLLKDRLTQAISLARRNHNQLAVLFLDLDGFKHINDSLGHAIGDKLLQSIAARLLGCVRKSDTVSRQGGDEFVILLSEVTHGADAAISAAKIITELKKAHRLGEHSLRVTVSIGLSTYPDNGEDAETLIKNADTAMYHAKQCGLDNYKFFRSDMGLQAVERQSLEGQLRYALERQELLLHYQPKVNLKTAAITSVEALLRWQHPERGLLLPGQFLPIAEDTGMIVAIGQWVLREACRQTREWLDAGLPAVPVAVNISSLEFRSEQFLEGIQVALKNARLDPRYLELELTETVLMRHAKSTAYALGQLKVIGVRLALDDFGTGYSSLSYLTRFPIDALKLDQSFVKDIIASTDDAIVVSAVISMGKSLKHRVIAEGVETLEQLAFLQAHGCDEGQGYYFSRPAIARQFANLLETGILATV